MNGKTQTTYGHRPEQLVNLRMLEPILTLLAQPGARVLMKGARAGQIMSPGRATRMLSEKETQALIDFELVIISANGEATLNPNGLRLLAKLTMLRERDSDELELRRVMTAGATETIVVNRNESPLTWLASRRGPDGRAFLTADEVEAGERLRSDFEEAHRGPKLGQNWDGFLTMIDRGAKMGTVPMQDGPASERLRAALAALGPGLGDCALRVCCYLEGLETVEREMGWSSRSAKVVLKIALERLSAHYGLRLTGTGSGIKAWRATG